MKGNSNSMGLVCVIGFLMMMVGCNDLQRDYGQSKGMTGRRSLNGFAGLRRAFETSGFESRDVTRLTQRMRRTDAIVWTPQELQGIPGDVTQWFDSWLRQGNRTLVYLVPDSGSEIDYWQEAQRLAPPDQRLEYRKRAARSINQRAIWQLNRRSVPSNGWFAVSPAVSDQTEFKIGPFEDTVTGSSGTAGGTAPPGFTGGFTGNQPTGPNSVGWNYQVAATAETSTKVQFDTLIPTDDGETLVAVIESKRWRGSRVIVVAGGSLLTNYAFSKPRAPNIAARIIEESYPPTESLTTDQPKVGFLTTDGSGVSVSEAKAGVPAASGMELLTVWPISLVTIHGVLLGLVVCLMLFPIFGRPRSVHQGESTDFGDHLEAVAALMHRAGDDGFAKQRISDYFKRVRGETTGPWVLPDPPHQESSTISPDASSAPSHLPIPSPDPPPRGNDFLE